MEPEPQKPLGSSRPRPNMAHIRPNLPLPPKAYDNIGVPVAGSVGSSPNEHAPHYKPIAVLARPSHALTVHPLTVAPPAQLVQTIRRVEAKYKHPICILADLQGPKLRVGVFKDDKVRHDPSLIPSHLLTGACGVLGLRPINDGLGDKRTTIVEGSICGLRRCLTWAVEVMLSCMCRRPYLVECRRRYDVCRLMLRHRLSVRCAHVASS